MYMYLYIYIFDLDIADNVFCIKYVFCIEYIFSIIHHERQLRIMSRPLWGRQKETTSEFVRKSRALGPPPRPTQADVESRVTSTPSPENNCRGSRPRTGALSEGS